MTLDTDALVIRHAGLEDVGAIARIHVHTWRHAYRGIVPDALLDSLDETKSASRVVSWLDAGKVALVAERQGSLVGFCSLLPSRDADAPAGTGEVAAIYVSPDQARRGAGRALLDASMAAARGRYPVLTLWVLADNAAARRFYTTVGFVDDGGRKQVVLGGARLEEIRYRIDVPEP